MFDGVKEYVNNRISYAKLEVVDSVSSMLGVAVFSIVVSMFVMLILLVGSLAFGFLLGNWLDNFGTGFLILLGFYALLLGIVFIFRKKIIGKVTDIAVAAAMEAIQNSEKDGE